MNARLRDAGLAVLGAGCAVWAAWYVRRALDGYPADLGLLALPLALALMCRLARNGTPGALRLAAGVTAVVAAAIYLAPWVMSAPLIALAGPAVLGSAFLFGRYPAAGVVLAFALGAGFGSIEALTPFPAGPAIDAILAGLWLAVGWTLVSRGRDRSARIWPGVAAMALYVGLSAVAILTASTLFFGLEAFRASAWYIAAFLLIAYAGWPEKTHARIVRGLVAVAAGVGAYALLRYLIGPTPEEYGYAVAADPTNIIDGELRLVGSFPSGKALASWCAVAVPFSLAIALGGRGVWRMLGAAAVALCSFALLASEVRAGLIGLVAGVVVVLALYQAARAFRGPHLGTTALAIAAVLVAGGVFFVLTAGGEQTSAARYERIFEPESDPAYQARLPRWRAAMESIEEHPLGQGLGTGGRIQRESGRFVSVASIDIDNSFLQIAYEQGIAVMLLFGAAAISLACGLGARAVRTLDPARAGPAIGACGGFVAYLCVLPTGSYISGLTTFAAFVVVGVGVAQFSLVEPAPARERRTQVSGAAASAA